MQLYHVVSPCLSLINLDNCKLIELKETQKAENWCLILGLSCYGLVLCFSASTLKAHRKLLLLEMRPLWATTARLRDWGMAGWSHLNPGCGSVSLHRPGTISDESMLASSSCVGRSAYFEKIPYVCVCVNTENIGAVWDQASLFPSLGGTS